MIDAPPAASGTDAGTAPASGTGAVHAGTGTGAGGAYVPIGRAAALLGLTGDVLRKRAAAGSVPARKVDSRWWIWVEGVAGGPQDVTLPSPPEPAPEAAGRAEPEPEAAVGAPEAEPAPLAPGREEWRQLVSLVEKLQEENRNLAGQLGFVQAQRQVLEERVRLLEAPPPAPEPGAVSPPEPEPAPAERPRPWWRFWA